MASASDQLIVEGIFDPSGIERGINDASRKLQDFAKTTQQQISFKSIGGDVDLATADFKSGKIALDDYNVALGTAKAQFEALRAQGLEPSRAAILKLNDGFEVGRVGGRRLESALTSIALAGAGVTGTTGRIIEGLVLFGAANVELVELAAAIGVVVAAYNLLTSAAQKAAAETKKVVDAQQKQQASAGDPGNLQHNIVEDMKRRVTLEKEIADWEKAIREDVVSGIPVYLEVNKLLKLRSELAGVELAQTVDSLALAKQRAEVESKRIQPGRDVITGLGTELGGLQTGPIQAADAARRNTIATTAMTDAQRIAANVLADLILKTELHAKALKDHEEATKKAAEATRKQNELWTWSRNAVEQLEHSLRSGLITGTNELTAEWKRGQKAVEEYARATQDVALGLVGIEFEIHAEHLRKVRDEIDKIRQAVSDLGSVSVDLGILSPEGNRALQDFADVGAQLAKGDLFGAVVGGLHLVADALGKSAIDREREAIMKENNLRLRELRLSLDRTTLGGGGLAKTQDILRSQLVLDTPQSLRGGPRSADEFTARLNAAGLSLRDFEILVKQQTGLEILDSKAHLLAGAFDAAREAIELTIKGMTHFSGDISTQERILETRDKLYGTGSRSAAQAALDRTRELIIGRGNLPGETAIGGVDLTTEAGREAYRKWLEKILGMAQAGQIGIAALGGFGSVDELLGPIGAAADALNSFNDAANQATRTLLNIPVGFNLAAAEFRASAVGSVPTYRPGDGASLPIPSIDPGRLTRAATQIVQWSGNIVIDGLGKNAEQIAREIKAVFRRDSMATTGTPDHWGGSPWRIGGR